MGADTSRIERQRNEAWRERDAIFNETFQFFVRMCGDVLLEMLYCGNRQQLVKLERVGRRIHLMVENFVGERPFLRLTFQIQPRFFYS